MQQRTRAVVDQTEDVTGTCESLTVEGGSGVPQGGSSGPSGLGDFVPDNSNNLTLSSDGEEVR